MCKHCKKLLAQCACIALLEVESNTCINSVFHHVDNPFNVEQGDASSNIRYLLAAMPGSGDIGLTSGVSGNSISSLTYGPKIINEMNIRNDFINVDTFLNDEKQLFVVVVPDTKN